LYRLLFHQQELRKEILRHKTSQKKFPKFMHFIKPFKMRVYLTNSNKFCKIIIFLLQLDTKKMLITFLFLNIFS